MTIAPERPAPPRPRTIQDLPKPREGWWKDAACRKLRNNDAASEYTFLDGTHSRVARWFCDRCPVVQECLIEAIRADDQVTFAGGMTAPQRDRWCAEQGITRPSPGKLDEAATRAIAAGIESGLTFDEIGRELGIRGDTLHRRWLRAQHPPKRRATTEQAERAQLIVQLRDEERLTWREVAARAHCGVETAMRWYSVAKAQGGAG